MGSSQKLFNRERTLHQILGSGQVADLILWRKKNQTLMILLVTVASWIVFERSGYTLLSLVSNVLLLLVVILFLWAKSAAILNRPAPPLPELHLSDEMTNEMAAFIQTRINNLFSVSQDIALGKDSRMFLKVAASLLLISIVGGITDFLTLAYTSLFIVLTLPALYERYEDYIDTFILKCYNKLCQLYRKINEEYVSKIQYWILEKKKLS
ncbi:reticulon-like protein B12 [Cicer arietinum]|uniref:Reticulon-like protein n=1 Tax=Cicer arietinum TaxID=3827 RepID=A0A3Q7Y6X2_CICAR|nr:reticulon-like protein B12 [Cicer arietinum]